MTAAPASTFFGKLPGRLLALSAAVVIGLSIARIPVFWTNHAYLGDVSGVWTGLAFDLSHGVFYRPTFGPDGYGGARYFPAHIVLHAGIMKLTGDPILSGQIVAAIAVSLLMLGAFLLLRALGATRLVAFASAAAILASQSTQTALLSIRGDALAAAFNILGVAIIAGPSAAMPHVVGSAAIFTLAFASKPTAIYGVAAATAWLLLSGRFRMAVILAATTMAGGVMVLGATHVLSGGRAFAPLGVGSSTRTTLGNILRAPMTFARIVRQVPETLAFVQLGIAATVMLLVRKRTLISLPVLLFAFVLMMSIAIFAFEGTDTNHLIDLHVASIVAVVAFTLSSLEGGADFGISALAVATLAASMSLLSGLINHEQEQRQGTLQEALAMIPDPGKPILAENPYVPIAAGQRPYMLNPYMFRLISQADPSFRQQLNQALDEQKFSAVVLERNPHDARGEDWYRNAYFGGDFIAQLERSYEISGRIGMRVVYRPKAR